MTDIIEQNTFTPAVPLIEQGDLVQGGINGDANKQAVALTNRTNYLKEAQDTLTSKVSNLSANDVKAEPKGTAAGIMQDHIANDDPHPVYLTKEEALTAYVQQSVANSPNGYLQLDDNGKIPGVYLDALRTTYIAVADKDARLALEQTENLIIAVQVDEDTLYYLNGDLDPSVETNWTKGQAATVSGVSRVFNRTGDIEAEAGDYNADQITETTNRVFLSPTDKTTFSGKQDKLNSSNLKTVFGTNLLGAGDVAPTPDEMGVAAKTHTHTTSQVTDFQPKVLSLIGSYIKPGSNVTVGYDNATGQTTISAALGSGHDSANNFIMVDRAGSTANQQHIFSFDAQSQFNLIAFALKSIAGATNQTYTQDTFTPASASNFNSTSQLNFNTGLKLIANKTLTTVADGDLYSVRINELSRGMQLVAQSEKKLFPDMTSNTTPSGYTASASSTYDGTIMIWNAFDNDPSSLWIGKRRPDATTPQWVQIQGPSAVRVTRYEVVNRLDGFINSPTAWTLQGSNDGNTWTVLDTRTDNDNTGGKVRSFSVTSPASYSYYRLNMTGSAISGAPTLADLNLYGDAGIKSLLQNTVNNKYYNIVNNALQEVTDTVTASYINSNGFTVASLTTSMLTTLGNNFKFVTGGAVDVSLLNLPPYQIAKGKVLTNGSGWKKINGLTGTITGTTSNVKVAFTKDLNEYFVFTNNVWTSIGTLAADSTGGDKLFSQGMLFSDVTVITSDQWNSFLADSNGVLGKIGFAYALGNATYGESVTLNSVNFNIDETGSWKLQTAAEVEIQWKTDVVTFKTIAAGDYKFAYQIP